MSKGKRKGFKKKQIEIRDEILNPFYIVRDDRQYITMVEGSSLPLGYFVKLSHALTSIKNSIQLEADSGTVFSLRGFINRSEELNNQIINAVTE